jgi:hypothetical protein
VPHADCSRLAARRTSTPDQEALSGRPKLGESPDLQDSLAGRGVPQRLDDNPVQAAYGEPATNSAWRHRAAAQALGELGPASAAVLTSAAVTGTADLRDEVVGFLSQDYEHLTDQEACSYSCRRPSRRSHRPPFAYRAMKVRRSQTRSAWSRRRASRSRSKSASVFLMTRVYGRPVRRV